MQDKYVMTQDITDCLRKISQELFKSGIRERAAVKPNGSPLDKAPAPKEGLHLFVFAVGVYMDGRDALLSGPVFSVLKQGARHP